MLTSKRRSVCDAFWEYSYLFASQTNRNMILSRLSRLGYEPSQRVIEGQLSDDAKRALNRLERDYQRGKVKEFSRHVRNSQSLITK